MDDPIIGAEPCTPTEAPVIFGQPMGMRIKPGQHSDRAGEQIGRTVKAFTNRVPMLATRACMGRFAGTGPRLANGCWSMQIQTMFGARVIS